MFSKPKQKSGAQKRKERKKQDEGLLCLQLSTVGRADACLSPRTGRVIIVTKARRSRKKNKKQKYSIEV